MEELKELRFNENNIQLKDNIVKGSILPEKVSELARTITVQGNSTIEGAVYGHKIEIQQGGVDFQASVFAKVELYVNSEAQGDVLFRKSVVSPSSVASRAQNCKLIFSSDINAKSVSLCNAFVAGSIYCDEAVLENCVVIGGVFATQKLDLNNSVVGTFNSPSVKASQNIRLLLPSAFSVEDISVTPDTKFTNLSLADLGALFRGTEEQENSGQISMDVSADSVKTVLSDGDFQKTLRSYTVVGKVLAADLIDTDKLQNHFLLTAASLGPQLLKTYSLGLDSEGKEVELTIDKLRDFFFDILHGRKSAKEMDGKFSISDLAARYS